MAHISKTADYRLPELNLLVVPGDRRLPVCLTLLPPRLSAHDLIVMLQGPHPTPAITTSGAPRGITKREVLYLVMVASAAGYTQATADDLKAQRLKGTALGAKIVRN